MARNVKFELIPYSPRVSLVVTEDSGHVLMQHIVFPEVALVLLGDLLYAQPGFVTLGPETAQILDAPLYAILKAWVRSNNRLYQAYSMYPDPVHDRPAIDPATDPLRDRNLPEDLVGLPVRRSGTELEPGC